MITKTLKTIAALALCVGLLAASAAADTKRVKATANDRWNPDFRHITPGDRIIWKNPARHDELHDLKSYGGNWNKDETLSPGESTRKRFRRTGTFKYRCVIHSNMSQGQCSGMCGVIHVAN
jgi:plastocyanin